MELFAFATIWTENFRSFSKKSSSNKWTSTTLTNETIIVPMTIFERYVSCSPRTYSKQSHREFHSKTKNKRLPVIGLLQAKHFFAKSRAKQSAQNGLSSREVNRWPANEFRQFVHVKHSRCLQTHQFTTKSKKFLSFTMVDSCTSHHLEQSPSDNEYILLRNYLHSTVHSNFFDLLE